MRVLQLVVLALGVAFYQQLTTPAAADDMAAQRQALEPYFRMYRPNGTGPFPTILLVSGCSGFTSSIAPQAYARLAESWRAKGYAVVFVDYLAARGHNAAAAAAATRDVEQFMSR
jgi:dienelactone hydrolase